MTKLKDHNAEVAQLVEHDVANVEVAGPSPVFRSIKNGPVRQEIECCNISHTDYGGVNESLGYILRQYAGKGSLTTFAEVKQMSKERGFDSHQDL